MANTRLKKDRIEWLKKDSKKQKIFSKKKKLGKCRKGTRRCSNLKCHKIKR